LENRKGIEGLNDSGDRHLIEQQRFRVGMTISKNLLGNAKLQCNTCFRRLAMLSTTSLNRIPRGDIIDTTRLLSIAKSAQLLSLHLMLFWLAPNLLNTITWTAFLKEISSGAGCEHPQELLHNFSANDGSSFKQKVGGSS